MSGKALITGGAGFIGTNLVSRLLRDGNYEVHVVDNFSNTANEKHLQGRDNLIVHRADLKDESSLSEHLEGMDYVVHLAAHTYVRESIEDLLNRAAKAGVKHFVFASTGAAIGNQTPPIHEEMVAKPISPYGASKLVGEAYCRVFAEISDMHCTALRFSNCYGPYSEHKTSVVAKFIKRIVNDEELEIYGDGTQTRDYLYVGDLGDVFLSIFKADYKFNIFQLASGVETSLNSLIDVLEKKFNRRVRRKYLDFNKGEVRYNYADVSKAKKILSFNPETGLEEGISRTVNWFLKR
jgi:UDP-glucose 4-epimerase